MDTSSTLILFLVGIACGFACRWIIVSKGGRAPSLAWVLGFLFGIYALMAYAFWGFIWLPWAQNRNHVDQ